MDQSHPVIREEGADLLRYAVADEGRESSDIYTFDDASDHIAVPAHRAGERGFARANATSPTASASLVLMPILGFAANEGLVNFDDAQQFAEVLVCQPSANAVAHVPRGAVRAKTHHAMDLKRTDALLTGEHQVNNPKPLAQGFVRVLKDRPDQHRKSVAGCEAITALPMEWLCMLMDIVVTATWASNSIGPTVPGQVSFAGVFIGESCLKLGDRQLMEALHGSSS
jgi:hypothetical protein